jgi:lipoxygenase homology domain-containing protein 1
VLDNKKFLKGVTQEGCEQVKVGKNSGILKEQVVIGNERGMLLNVWDDHEENTQFKSMMASHYGEVSGLAPHPFEEGKFATVGEDGILNIWDALEKKITQTSELPHPARNVCWSPDGEWIAVGFCDGYMGIYDCKLLRERVEHHTLAEDIDQIKWSPDGRWLAAGSHDNYIDIFDCKKGFKFRNRFKGHTSYITHIDFSTDSRMLMSNCGASEILIWDVPNKKQLRAKAEMPHDPNDSATWGRMTCVLGFPVMGIWPDFSDGTDVNALHVNEARDICVTADDFGEVKLFNFPCVTEDAAFRAYRGHSSFVNNVAFVKGDSHVISCGSADLTVMQWKFTHDVDVLKPVKNAMKLFSGVTAFKSAKKKSLKEEASELKLQGVASKFMQSYGS